MFTQDFIYKSACKGKFTIGLGCYSNEQSITASCTSAIKKNYADKVVIFYDENDLLHALKTKEIDCAVRGTLNANKIVMGLKRIYKIQHLARVAILGTINRKELVLLAPVGIDEGKSLEEKLEIAILSAEVINKFGSDIHIGILAGGRLDDSSRNKSIKKELDNSLKLLNIIKAHGLSAEFYGIELESASIKSNCIIAPEGVSGNFIFRSLHFLGGWYALGAPVLNLKQAIFIDTSRNKSDFTDSIALASAIAYQNSRNSIRTD